MNLPGYDIGTEQIKDKELSKLEEELQSGKGSQAINSKHILLDNWLLIKGWLRSSQLALHSWTSKERGNVKISWQ